MLSYNWSVFALFQKLLFKPSYPSLDWYEQACRFLPVFRLLWPSLALLVQMSTTTQERALLRVRARHATMSKICPGYVQERAYLRVRALQVRLVECFSEYWVLDGRLYIRRGHGHLLVRYEVRYHVRHEDIIMVVSPLDVTV